jgi:hypothetical protein
MFDYLDYKNTIPLEKCLLGKVKVLNPVTAEYNTYWKTQRRACVEGNWIEDEGRWRWMPGPLYFYVNFWHIEGKKLSSKTKGKTKMKPLLRDVEWIKFYVNACIRGFSGFAEDEYFSCHRIFEDSFDADKNLIPVEQKIKELPPMERYKVPHFYRPDGKLKKYVPALEYLYDSQLENYGKPLYHNQNLNLVDLEARGGGKSYTSAALCAHNFLFDGALDYDAYLQAIKDGEPMSSQTLIGAIDTKYTAGVYEKLFYGIDNLEGGISINGRDYPSPLSKQYTGSPSKMLIAQYKEKRGGQWHEGLGSKSKLHHRTFGASAMAANGTRPSFGVIDEIGFHHNLPDCLGQLKECTADGGQKDGSVHMCGTGGDMEGGSTEAVKIVFYDPEAWDCMAFDDIFEETGKKIGFFFPAYMTLNDFKDEYGNTNRDAAIAYLKKERERLKLGKSKKPYEDELQQRPLLPSEVFLLSEGNIFPALELKAHLQWLESSLDADIKGQAGELTEGVNGVEWVPDLSGRLHPNTYPILKADEDTTGAIVIWKHPMKNAPYGLFVAGCDPYAQDPNKGVRNSITSLGSVFVIQRSMLGFGGFDEVVAEYSAKPEAMKTFYENVRKLMVYYNASLLYENQILGLKSHMETMHSLHYLAYTPTILKANQSSTVSRVYGQHASEPVRDELELMTRDWLLEPCGEVAADGTMRLNLHNIYSVPLLRELIAYNDHGNFDRVDAFMFAVCQKRQLHHHIVQKKEAIKRDSFFNRVFNGGNRY